LRYSNIRFIKPPKLTLFFSCPQQQEPLLSDDERSRLSDQPEESGIYSDDGETTDGEFYLSLPPSATQSPMSLSGPPTPTLSPSMSRRPSIDQGPPRSFHELPEEILVTIFRQVDCEDLCALRSVCKRWLSITGDNSLWMMQWQLEWPYDPPPKTTRRVDEPRNGSSRARTRLSVVSIRDLFAAKKMQELDMSSQKYAALEQALQKDMRFLSHLQIKDQMLRTLPPSISSIPLQSLSLIYTKFRHFPTVLTEMVTLRELNMGYNQLRTLPPEIGKLTNLTKLCLNNNQLRTLPSELGSLEKLQVLDLFFNSISELPKEIGQLTRLESLAVQNNKLRGVPSSIGSCTHLQSIDLSSNKLESIPNEFASLCNLRILSLASNLIACIPDIFEMMSSLRELNLFENKLPRIPKSLENASTRPDGVCLIFLGENPIEDESIPSLINMRNKEILNRRREQQALAIPL
jgi:hypothetical protein